MIDILLFFGKLLLLALMYLFLFTAVRAGLGAVNEASAVRSSAGLALAVVRGPKEIVGVKIPLAGRVTIGRAPDVDLAIADDFVSTHHAAVSAANGAFVLEDLDSTNGTIVNGQSVSAPVKLKPGDVVEVGRTVMEVRKS